MHDDDGPGAEFLTVDGFEDGGPRLRVFQARSTEIMPNARHDDQAWHGIHSRSVHQVRQEQDAQQRSGQIVDLQPNTNERGESLRWKRKPRKTKSQMRHTSLPSHPASERNRDETRQRSQRACSTSHSLPPRTDRQTSVRFQTNPSRAARQPLWDSRCRRTRLRLRLDQQLLARGWLLKSIRNSPVPVSAPL